MSDIAIKIDGLGKRYRLAAARKRYKTIRESLIEALAVPARMVRKAGRNKADEQESSFWALKDVTFEAKQGEVVGIIGRNGAGKSTLLKVLSRITEPTEGQIEITGRVGSLLEVGTGFHPELTGRENIYLNGAILGMTRRDITRKFDEIVAFAETEKFLDTPVKHYSSGMYTRLAFAVAAHLEPEILVVDEVLAVGDVEFQKKCMGKMGQVAQGGRTVLFVSHNMPAVRTLCTTGCVLASGRVAMRGSAADCVDFYMQQATQTALKNMVQFPQPLTPGPWMVSATVLNGGESASTLRLGDKLGFDIEFTSDHPVQYPSLGFVIFNSRGDPVLNANNRYQVGATTDSPLTQGRLTCDLGMVPLMPGRYSASLWFGDHVHDSHFVDGAFSFDVIEHDAWGTGKTPPPNISSLWWPTRFVVTAA